MHCHQIVEWGKPLEVRDYPNPKPTGSEVLVKVEAAGVCHSDIHIRQGYFDLGDGERSVLEERGAKLPMTLGHETVGEVAELGPDADGVSVGDKRIVFPWIGCGDCDWCNAGTEYLCNTPKFLGARVNGGYSDYVMVPHPRYLIPYDGIESNLACTYACSGITAFSALQKIGDISGDDTIVVIGAGGVGFNAVHIARAMYDAKIIVADIDPAKRDALRDMDRVTVIDNSEAGAAKEVMGLTNGGAKATLDFVGAPQTSQFGLNVMRKSGTHVVIGLYGKKLPIALPLFPSKEITMRGSYVGNLQQMHDLMDLVRTGKVPQLPVHPRPLDQAEQALQDLEAGKVVGRIVLNP
jgi:D-arabinose 1-dehydrogenase-like Zn-dependent alcohol dehydrogenase